uniref:Uncharacterized protein n=1 Tax=Anopheles coluzzii TaxID=1518534 RepID=A0A8W7Q0K6_ANOCL
MDPFELTVPVGSMGGGHDDDVRCRLPDVGPVRTSPTTAATTSSRATAASFSQVGAVVRHLLVRVRMLVGVVGVTVRVAMLLAQLLVQCRLVATVIVPAARPSASLSLPRLARHITHAAVPPERPGPGQWILLVAAPQHVRLLRVRLDVYPAAKHVRSRSTTTTTTTSCTSSTNAPNAQLAIVLPIGRVRRTATTLQHVQRLLVERGRRQLGNVQINKLLRRMAPELVELAFPRLPDVLADDLVVADNLPAAVEQEQQYHAAEDEPEHNHDDDDRMEKVELMAAASAKKRMCRTFERDTTESAMEPQKFFSL